MLASKSPHRLPFNNRYYVNSILFMRVSLYLFLLSAFSRSLALSYNGCFVCDVVLFAKFRVWWCQIVLCPLSLLLPLNFFFPILLTTQIILICPSRTEQNRERERERAIRTREIDRSIVSIYYYFLLLIYIFRNIELFHIWTQRAEIHRGKVSP